MWVFGKENRQRVCVLQQCAPGVGQGPKRKTTENSRGLASRITPKQSSQQQHTGVGTQLLPKELNVRQRTGSEDED